MSQIGKSIETESKLVVSREGKVGDEMRSEWEVDPVDRGRGWIQLDYILRKGRRH